FPRGSIVTLLGWLRKDRDRSYFLRPADEINRVPVLQNYAGAEILRIRDLIPRCRFPRIFIYENFYYFEPVRLGEGSEEELGSKLVKSMTHRIVGRRNGYEVTADAHRLHTVSQSQRVLEDVFERPTIEDQGESLGEFVRQGQIHIVQDRSTFERGKIKRI